MKRFFTAANMAYFLLFSFIANSYLLIRQEPAVLWAMVPIFLWIILFAGIFCRDKLDLRWRICRHGGILLEIFPLTLIPSVLYHGILAFFCFPADAWTWIWSAVFCICAEAILFWIGILIVYCTSLQMGIKLRVVGALCGLIPVLNLIQLNKIIATVQKEIDGEIGRARLNAERKGERICATKYPILLVHGVFFRDFKYFNYWGRIPRELEKNGARIFYGEHGSALSIRDSARELTERIHRIVAETGCEKVNIIAHSKGGLDCRCAMAECGAAPYIASLTTVNTPHRGCLFADRLLSTVPEEIQESIADAYNKTLRKLGDPSPDFLAAVRDLTSEACEKTDEAWPQPAGVFCQSIGSKLKRAKSGKFPLNFSYHLVKYFDGANDGLVGEASFSWGDRFRMFEPSGDAGISHSDIIDLGRENIDGFDVREMYVELVRDLKERGL